MTWPTEYGGQEGEGIYEYLLNEALAARGGPQIGKGVGIIGKTLIAHGSEFLKEEFLPKILANEVEFAVGYSEPEAGSDAAAMKLKATETKRRLDPQRPEDLDHLGPLRRVVLGRRPHRSRRAPKHFGITLFLVPLPTTRDIGGITVQGIMTMGDELTNDVFFDDVFVPDEYVVGDLNHGFQYISQALDLERFTMFTFSPVGSSASTCWSTTSETPPATASRSRTIPKVRSRIAHLATTAEVARGMGLRVVDASMKAEPGGGHPPTVEASEYKLFTTEFSKRLADASMDLGGPGTQLRVGTEEAPMAGPGRVDLPLHGARHHRRRHLRGAEEHHHPTGPRPPEELLGDPACQSAPYWKGSPSWTSPRSDQPYAPHAGWPTGVPTWSRSDRSRRTPGSRSCRPPTHTAPSGA